MCGRLMGGDAGSDRESTDNYRRTRGRIATADAVSAEAGVARSDRVALAAGVDDFAVSLYADRVDVEPVSVDHTLSADQYWLCVRQLFLFDLGIHPRVQLRGQAAANECDGLLDGEIFAVISGIRADDGDLDSDADDGVGGAVARRVLAWRNYYAAAGAGILPLTLRRSG